MAGATGTWRSLTRGAVRPLALLALCLAVGAVSARAQDTPAATPNSIDDPLAWRRLDLASPVRSITVVDVNEGQTRKASGRQLLAGSQEMYLRSATVANIFQASRLWQAETQRLTLQVQDIGLRVMAGSRLVVQDETELLLPVPVVAADGDVWLPMTFLVDVLGPRVGQTVTWDADARRLMIGSQDVNVTGLRVTELTRATSVHVLCKDALSYRTSSPVPGTVEIKIYGGQVDPGHVSLGSPRGLVQWVRSRQHDGYALVTIGLDDLVTRYRTHTEDEGRDIVLVAEEEQPGALPEPVARGQAHVSVPGGPVNVSRALEIRTVVIDPGHGGSDAGVRGPDGILEKTINLEVSKELAKVLRRAGLRVVLTRDDDVHVPLAERAEIANSNGGDLFLSLHCNGWFSEGATGLETYFLSPAKTDWSQSVEATENQGAAGDDVDFIVWELVQNRFISSSSDLAEVIQHMVSDRLGLPDRGVRQAGFRVLVGAYMPAVLVEMGFLSNPAEENRLRDGSYQRKLAAAIGDAIVAYRDKLAEAAAASSGGDGQ